MAFTKASVSPLFERFKPARRHFVQVTSCAGQEQEKLGCCSRRVAIVAPLVLVAHVSHATLSAVRDLNQILSHFSTCLIHISETLSKLELVRQEVRKVVSKAKSPGVLRLVFHDAGTFNAAMQSGGINGSILYELERPENAGLERSVKVLRKAKEALEPSTRVSWADLIAVAGSEAVTICGGPDIPVRLGRLDSSGPDPEGQLPGEDLELSSLKQSFLSKGFSIQEMVVLSGAHTLGGKGFGDPTSFDNSYFEILLKKPWTDGKEATSMIGIPSDRLLVEDEECLHWLEVYRADEAKFFSDFAGAYSKLISSGARWA